MRQLPSGARAPEFELESVEGTVYRLSEALAAGPVILVFFKASCPTCQFTFPFLEKIYSALGPTSTARLWGISQDEREETQQFIDEYGVTFDVLLDEHPYLVSSAYNLTSVPAIFMAGTDGVIQVSDQGFTKASLTEVSRILAGANRFPLELFRPNDGLPASRPG